MQSDDHLYAHRTSNLVDRFMKFLDRACLNGSDIHVMLTLYSDFGQVVVANEILDRADMIGQLLGKRQRTANQA